MKSANFTTTDGREYMPKKLRWRVIHNDDWSEWVSIRIPRDPTNPQNLVPGILFRGDIEVPVELILNLADRIREAQKTLSK